VLDESAHCVRDAGWMEVPTFAFTAVFSLFSVCRRFDLF
jgi:hypothetical protein